MSDNRFVRWRRRHACAVLLAVGTAVPALAQHRVTGIGSCPSTAALPRLCAIEAAGSNALAQAGSRDTAVWNPRDQDLHVATRLGARLQTHTVALRPSRDSLAAEVTVVLPPHPAAPLLLGGPLVHVRAACALTDPAPRVCAIEKAGQAALRLVGRSDTLRWNGGDHLLHVGTPNGPPVPTVVESLTTEGDSVHALVAVAASGNASVAVAPPVPAAAPATPPPVGPPVLALHLVGPTTPPVLLIGRAQPTVVTATLFNGPHEAATGRILSGTCHNTDHGDALEVVRTATTDGTVTCLVRLSDTADSAFHYQVVITAKTTNGDVRLIAPVAVLRVPTYAVRGDKDCLSVVNRTAAVLQQDGVPVVSFDRADRRLTLTACQRIERIMPVMQELMTASALYVQGEITEPTAGPFADATFTGPFMLTFSRPGTDPEADAAQALVERLLKYRPL